MVVVPFASVFVALFAMPTVFVPLYVVPFTVTDHFFEVDESILPSLPEISSNFQLIVDVLFTTDWLVVSQLNFSVFQEVTATLVLPFEAIMIHPLHTHSSHFLFRLLPTKNRTNPAFG